MTMAAAKRNSKTESLDDKNDDPEDIVNAIVLFRTQRLPSEKQVLIEVNAVDSPHRFFFNYLGPQYNSLFMKTMDEIQFDYRHTNRVYAIPRARLRMGMACVVKYMSVFFRGVCIDVNEDFVEVFTIDYGKKVVVLMRNYDSEPLFWLRRKYKHMPCQAIPGQLHTVFPKKLNWTQEAADFMLEKLADKEIYAEIARNELPGETVAMCLNDPSSGQPMDQCLVSAGHAVYVGMDGLDMIDNEVLSQRIYDHQEALRQEEKEASLEEAPPLTDPVISVENTKDEKVVFKPVTFDNMLEALDCSSSSSSSSSSCNSSSLAGDVKLETEIALDTVSFPLTVQVSTGEQVADNLPTALVRPSMRAEQSQEDTCEPHGVEEEAVEGTGDIAPEDTERVCRSVSPSTIAIERLLKIDTSKVECPVERARLKAELEREMELLRIKLELLDMKLNDSKGVADMSISEVSNDSSKASFFNPEAEPFIPRNFISANTTSTPTPSSSGDLLSSCARHSMPAMIPMPSVASTLATEPAPARSTPEPPKFSLPPGLTLPSQPPAVISSLPSAMCAPSQSSVLYARSQSSAPYAPLPSPLMYAPSQPSCTPQFPPGFFVMPPPGFSHTPPVFLPPHMPQQPQHPGTFFPPFFQT